MTNTAYRDELDRETDFDDDIRDAMYDATCNAEGENSPKYLRAELMKRGLCIASDVPMGWKVSDPKSAKYGFYQMKEIAAAMANKYGWIMEPLYAAIK